MAGPTKVKDSVSAITLPTGGGNWVDVTTIAGVSKLGAIDCTAALNNAIAAAPGKVYYFPEGTYLVSSASLALGAGTILRGAGAGLSIIKNTSYATFGGPLVDTGTGSGHEIYDLGFTYVGSVGAVGQGSSTALVIKARSTSKFKLINCRITVTQRVSAAIGVNSWFAPRSGAAAVTDYVIKGNTITTVGDYNIDVNSIVTDGYIQDNNCITTASSTAGSTCAIFAALCNNITIDSNSAQMSISIQGCSSSNVINNDVNFNFNPANVAGGIWIRNETTGAGTGNTNCLVANNTVNVSNYAGISAAAIYIQESTSTGNSIIGNIVITSGGHNNDGISVKSPNNVIANNFINGLFTNSINIVGTSGNNTVTGNICKGAYNGGIVYFPNTVTDGIHIASNVIIDNNQQNQAASVQCSGIYLNTGTTNHTIIGNHIKAPAGINPSYGVRGSTLTANSMVIGNNCVAAQTTAISVGAATVAGNI